MPTKIEWCDETFNPWVGCAKISLGCEHCYAERDFGHRRGFAQWGEGKPRRRTAVANWLKPLRWNRKCEKDGTRLTVFSGSLCDIADPEVPQDWFDDLMRLVLGTPHLTWLLLTKRPFELHTRMLEWFCEPLEKNLWLGVTVENQEMANKRITELLKIPAAGYFVSMEPLLGPVNLHQVMIEHNGYPIGEIDALRGIYAFPHVEKGTAKEPCRKLDWAIVGGENGPGARPMDERWALNILEQCQNTSIPFLYKSSGGREKNRTLAGQTWEQFPGGLK